MVYVFIVFSEIGADEKGFTVELWKKGLLWDSILGVLWIPLSSVEHATYVSWLSVKIQTVSKIQWISCVFFSLRLV